MTNFPLAEALTSPLAGTSLLITTNSSPGARPRPLLAGFELGVGGAEEAEDEELDVGGTTTVGFTSGLLSSLVSGLDSELTFFSGSGFKMPAAGLGILLTI